MGLIELIVLLVVVGLILWLVQTFIPMDAAVKRVLQAVVVLLLILFLVHTFFPGIANLRVG